MNHGHSLSHIYLHVVWATFRREPILMPELERAVHRCIQQQVQGTGCTVLVLEGVADHVHLVVQTPTRVSVAHLMQCV